MSSWARSAAPGFALLALTGALVLLFADSVLLTSDAVMALAWGNELASGRLPDTAAPLLPVFHPLPTLVGAILSPLGVEGALDAYRLLAIASFVAFLYGAYRIGRAIGGVAVGLAAATLIMTRPAISFYAGVSSIDVPFAALVLLATALVLERPLGNRWWALSLLALAGLMRPEAWLLALAYGAWLALRTRGAERAAVAALTLSAPVIWSGMDLASTGNVLASAEQAQASLSESLAEAGFPVDDGLDAPRVSILESHWRAVTALLGTPLAIGGLAAAIWALLRRPWPTAAWPRREPAEPQLDPESRARVVAVLALLVLVTLLALHYAGLAFADRFAIPPAVCLTALFAFALLRFSPPWPWRAGLAAVAAAVVVTIPGDVAEVVDYREEARPSQRTLEQVSELARSSRTLDALQACPDAAAGGELFVTIGLGVVASATNRDPAGIEIVQRPGAAFDTVLLYEGDPGSGPGPEDDPRRLVERNGPWSLWSRC